MKIKYYIFTTALVLASQQVYAGKGNDKNEVLQISNDMTATSIQDWTGDFEKTFNSEEFWDIYTFSIESETKIKFDLDLSGKTSTVKLNLFSYDPNEVDLSSITAKDMSANYQYINFDMSGSSSDNWSDINNNFLNQLSGMATVFRT